MSDKQIEAINDLRGAIKGTAADLLALKRGMTGAEAEAVANLMLAYRHLEDASMRLGKVIQALDGEAINDLRGAIKGTAADLLALKRGMTGAEAEAVANLMLAYRHLEDASMRLGKVIQALDGGVSVYDRRTTVGA